MIYLLSSYLPLNIEAYRFSEREIGVIGDPDITYNV